MKPAKSMVSEFGSELMARARRPLMRLISPGLTLAVVFRGSFIAASGFVAQALPFLAMPVLTRLYDPSAFGLYTIIAALVACIGGAAPMKFDVAIPISKSPDEARSLWQISTIVTVLVLFALLVIWRGSPNWVEHIQISSSGGTWPLVLAASGVAAAYQYNSAWLLYAHSYVAISLTRLARGLCFVGFAFLFLDSALGNRGLLFGFLVATLIGTISSFVVALWQGLRPFRLHGISAAFRHYSDFPFKAAIPAMLDLVALAAPLLAISRLYSINDAAMFGLFRQAITAPFSLVSTAFGQVLTRQLAELIAAKERVYRLVLNTSVVLGLISGLVAAVVLLDGPEVFRTVFGAKWAQAGSIAAILVVPAGCQFIASTLSGTLIALRSLTWLAFWQIGYFLVIFLLIYLEPPSLTHFIYGLAAVDFVLSLAYLAIIARAIWLYERSGCEPFATTT